MKENPFMQVALEEAHAAAKRGEVPVGACLVFNDQVVARHGNRMVEQNNPTAHAEMLVMREGLIALGQKRLDGCVLYVTLEPCTMCAGAIALNHIGRLYYGAADEKAGNIAFFSSPRCLHRPEIYSSIGEAESAALLQKFFRTLREK